MFQDVDWISQRFFAAHHQRTSRACSDGAVTLGYRREMVVPRSALGLSSKRLPSAPRHFDLCVTLKQVASDAWDLMDVLDQPFYRARLQSIVEFTFHKVTATLAADNHRPP